jgi:hypothetical protein
MSFEALCGQLLGGNGMRLIVHKGNCPQIAMALFHMAPLFRTRQMDHNEDDAGVAAAVHTGGAPDVSCGSGNRTHHARKRKRQPTV